MRCGNLAIAILQDIRISPLQHTGQATAKACRMLSQLRATSTCLYANELYFLVANKLVEYANRIRSTAHTCNNGCRQSAFRFQNLLAGFTTNHGMKIAHHRGIRMRTQDAPQQVVSGANIGDPVSHRFIDRVLERARTRLHAPYLRPQQAHAEDVQLLPPHVLDAHIDHALQPEKRADCGSGNTMLSRSGFSNNSMLAHSLRQQRLAQTVVDLVCAGMQQVFPFQVDFGAANFFGQMTRKKQWRWAARIVLQQLVKFSMK